MALADALLPSIAGFPSAQVLEEKHAEIMRVSNVEIPETKFVFSVLFT